MNEPVPMDTGHVAIGLGDNPRCLLNSGFDDVDTHSEAHIPMVIGQGGLNQGHIHRHKTPRKEARDLRQEDGSIIRHPLIDGTPSDIPNEKGVMAKVLFKFLIRIRSNSESPDMEDFGIKEGFGIAFDKIDQGADDVLGLSTSCTNKYFVAGADVVKDLVLGGKLFRIDPLHFFDFPVLFSGIHPTTSSSSLKTNCIISSLSNGRHSCYFSLIYGLVGIKIVLVGGRFADKRNGMIKERGMIPEMDETRQFAPSEEWSRRAHIHSLAQYQEMYERSLEDPEGFWAECAEELHWFKKWDRVYEGDFGRAQVKWFVGGKLNAAYNCLDRHLHSGQQNRVAIRWVGQSGESKTYTYSELHREVCRFANALKRLGVKKGDRVAIYLPMIPELPVAMLACARIGAIHNVVFIGFSAESLRERIVGCKASLTITSNYAFSGGKVLPTKRDADAALRESPEMKRVVVRSLEKEVERVEGRDFFWDELMNQKDLPFSYDPEEMDAEDPLFILYTSGSTGKPKGALHTTAGYLLHVKKSFEWVFDYHPEDLYWCTEDFS